MTVRARGSSRPRRRLLGVGVFALSLSLATPMTGADEASVYDLLSQLVDGDRRQRREVAEQLVERRDPAVVPGLVDALFFVPRNDRGPIFKALRGLTGDDAGRSYLEWVEVVGRRQDIEPAPGYLDWKRHLLSRIDSRYEAVFYPGAPSKIRLEEIVSGGVVLEGIPALDDPQHVAADEAAGLNDKERVFGLVLGGEARAYPLRYLSWHELANDVLGGEPLVLSYCTLCGSGIAYAATTPNGSRMTFGTSGLLYRSNKLMVDRSTLTLWSNLTGEPVVGRLARSPVSLEMLPMALTTWGSWKRDHPQTTVVELDRSYGARWGFRYRPGVADRARKGVAFPVWQRSDLLDRDAEVYGLRAGEAAKAYPLEILYEQQLVHDGMDGLNLVIVADADSGAVRAYRASDRHFQRLEDEQRLMDDKGLEWRLTEEALQPPAESDLEPLPRIAGHRAFWFGWYAFFPHTEVYGATGTEGP